MFKFAFVVGMVFGVKMKTRKNKIATFMKPRNFNKDAPRNSVFYF